MEMRTESSSSFTYVEPGRSPLNEQGRDEDGTHYALPEIGRRGRGGRVGGAGRELDVVVLVVALDVLRVRAILLLVVVVAEGLGVDHFVDALRRDIFKIVG